MEQYKKDFIDFLLKNGLLISEEPSRDKSLKSKRISPWFLNVGDFNDGVTTGILADAYADAIISSDIKGDLLYGIPEKGVGFVSPVSVAMARKGANVLWFFTRKIPKEYGEATAGEDITKQIVGRVPKQGQLVIQLDDVFTTGQTKYEATDKLNEIAKKVGSLQRPLLVIALDRQEVDTDGKNAIIEYETKTGTKVISIINALEVIDYLKDNITIQTPDITITRRGLERVVNYLRVYGTEVARSGIVEKFGRLEQRIIERDRSIIPACDVPTIEQFEELVKKTADVEGVGGYKIGFELGLGYGLERVVESARKHTNKPIIYDHQKAGTDIPDTGKNFAKVCKKAGVDAVILFPQAGPETERAWIYHALDYDLGVIVGGRMTHSAYTQSEGGFISDEGALEMYRIAARAGINNFVVPGNKPDVIKLVKETVEAEGVNPIFYAPGFVAQGGKIEDAAKVAGDKWHAIVGRGIYQAEDMKKAALEHTSQL